MNKLLSTFAHAWRYQFILYKIKQQLALKEYHHPNNNIDKHYSVLKLLSMADGKKSPHHSANVAMAPPFNNID